jgi:hypothetical protein
MINSILNMHDLCMTRNTNLSTKRARSRGKRVYTARKEVGHNPKLKIPNDSSAFDVTVL